MERRSKKKTITNDDGNTPIKQTAAGEKDLGQEKKVSRKSPRKCSENSSTKQTGNQSASQLLVDPDEDMLSTSNELHVEILATDLPDTGSVTKSGRKVKTKVVEKPKKVKVNKKTADKNEVEKPVHIIEEIDEEKEKDQQLEIAKRRKGSYQCYECQEFFKTFPDLCNHLFRHPVNHPRLCENCGTGFISSKQLRFHESRKTYMCTEMPYECEKCPEGFTTKYLLDFHMEEHKTNDVIQCGYCEVYFPNGNNFLKHLSPGNACFLHIQKAMADKQFVKNNPPYVCKDCDRKFHSASYLYLHMDTHGKKDVFLCTNCGVGFNGMDEESIAEHKKSHEQMTFEVNMQCDVCDEYFTDKDLLIKHKKCHLGVDYYDCHLCKDRFTDGSSLLKHLNDPDVTCKLSDDDKEKIASTKDTDGEDLLEGAEDEMDIDDHHLTWHNENAKSNEKDTVVKDICKIYGENKFSSSKSSGSDQNEVVDYGSHCSCFSLFVTKHVKQIYHKQDDIFRCDTCNETFKTYLQLYYHLNEHKYTHIHICISCGLGIEKMKDFEDHRLKHFEEKEDMPYECSICEERFLHADLINLHHETVHEGKEMLYCGRCSIGFDERRKFIEHYESHRGMISGLYKPTGKKQGLSKDQTDCEYCSYTTVQHKIHYHVRTKHRLLCHACKVSFETYRMLKDHVLQHPEEYPFRCGLCTDSFDDVKELVHHINIHKVREQEWFVCRICSEKVLSKDNFEKHQKTHVCEHCHLVIKSTENLNTHKEKCYRNKIPSSKYVRVCPCCAQGFRSLDIYKRHFSTHKKKGKFSCETCPHASFFTEIELERHYGKKHHRSKANLQNSENNEGSSADSDEEEFCLEMELSGESDGEIEKNPANSQQVDEPSSSVMNLLGMTLAGQSPIKVATNKHSENDTSGQKEQSNGNLDKSEPTTINMSSTTLENLETYQQLITKAKNEKSELDSQSVIKLLQETKEIRDKIALEEEEGVPPEKGTENSPNENETGNSSEKEKESRKTSPKPNDVGKKKKEKPATPGKITSTSGRKIKRPAFFDELSDQQDTKRPKITKITLNSSDIKQEPIETLTLDNSEPQPTLNGTKEKHSIEELDGHLQNMLNVKVQAQKLSQVDIDNLANSTSTQLLDVESEKDSRASGNHASKRRKLGSQKTKAGSSQSQSEKAINSSTNESNDTEYCSETQNLEMDTSEKPEITPLKSDGSKKAKKSSLSNEVCTPIRKSGRARTESTKFKLARESMNFSTGKSKAKKEDVQIKQEAVDDSENDEKMVKGGNKWDNEEMVKGDNKGDSEKIVKGGNNKKMANNNKNSKKKKSVEINSDLLKTDENSNDSESERDIIPLQISETSLIDTLIDSEEKVFECSHCGLSFVTPVLLFTHISTHHTGEYVYLCYTCGQGIGCQKFQANRFEKEHSKLHEKNLSDFPFKCDTPSGKKHFKHKKLLDLHQRVEIDPDSLLQCDVCHKNISYFRFLVAHFKKCFMKKYMYLQEISNKEKLVSSTSSSKKNGKQNKSTETSQEKQPTEDEYPEILESSEQNNDTQSKEHREGLLKQLLSIHELKEYGIYITTQKVDDESNGLFFCEVCGERGSDYTEFYLHLKDHAGRGPSICLACGRGINASSHNKYKWNKLHKNHDNLPVTCETCQCIFAKNELLAMHTTSEHNGKGLFICRNCGKDFQTPSMYTFHINLGKQCGRLKKDSVFNKKAAAENEKQKTVPATDTALKGTDNKPDVIKSKPRKRVVLRFPVNVKLTSDERRYLRKQNQERLKLKFKKARKLLQAKETAKDQATGIKCYVCHRFFKFGQFLCEHGRSFTYHKASVCNECGRVFRTRELFEVHFKRKHIGLQKRPYTCQICKRKFAVPRDLQLHLQAIHNLKPSNSDDGIQKDDHVYIPTMSNDTNETPRYINDLKSSEISSSNPDDYIIEQNGQLICSICGYIFKSKRRASSARCTLRKHIVRKHIGEKKHHCSICNYACVFDKDLKDHMEYCHSGTQTCNICNQTLASKRGLRLHTERNHKEAFVLEMKFKCRFCGEGFGYMAEKRRHEKEKHSDIKYQCDICKNTLTDELGLRRHFQKVHGIEREKAYEKVRKIIFTPSQNIAATKKSKDRQKETTEAADFIQQYLLESMPKSSSTNAKDVPLKTKEDSSENDENSLRNVNERGDNGENMTENDEETMDDDDVTSDEFRLCHICGALQLSQTSLSAHILSAHKKPVWICNVCGSLEQSKAKATKHRQEFHKEIGSNDLCFTQSIGIPENTEPSGNGDTATSVQKIINEENTKTCNDKTGSNENEKMTLDDDSQGKNTDILDDDDNNSSENDIEGRVQIRGDTLSTPVQKLLNAFENISDNTKSSTVNVSTDKDNSAVGVNSEEIDDRVRVLNDLDVINEDGLYTATRLELSPMKKLNKFDSFGLESTVTSLSTSSSLESRLMAENSGLINFTKIEPSNSDSEILVQKESEKLETDTEKLEAEAVSGQRNIIQKDFTQNEIDIASSLLKLEPPIEAVAISKEYSEPTIEIGSLSKECSEPIIEIGALGKQYSESAMDIGVLGKEYSDTEGPVVIAYLQTGNVEASSEVDLEDASNNEPGHMCENLTIVPIDSNMSAQQVQSAYIENVDIENEITVETTRDLAMLCHKVALSNTLSKSVKKRAKNEKITILTVVEDQAKSKEKDNDQSISTNENNTILVEHTSDSSKISEQSNQKTLDQTSAKSNTQGVETKPEINIESKKSDTDGSSEKPENDSQKSADNTEAETNNKEDIKPSNLINTECELGNIKLPSEKFTADDKIHHVINVPGRLNTPFQAVVKVPDSNDEIQNTVVNLPGNVQSVDLTVANMDTDDEDVYLLFFI